MVSNLNVLLPNTASHTPKPFLIGLGCQKHTRPEQILLALHEVLEKHRAYAYKIAVPAFKYRDTNIQNLYQNNRLPIHFISRKTLQNIQPHCQSFSNKVYQLTGFGSVAEACLLAIMHEKDYLLIPKMIYKGITLSLACKGSLLQ